MLTFDMDTSDTPSRLAGLLISGAAGVSRGANTPQVGGSGWMVLKSDGSPDTGGTPVATETSSAAGTADSTEQVTVTKADYDALVLKAAKADDKGKDDEADDEDKPAFMKKALEEMPEAVRKHIESMQTQVAKAQADADAATAVAKAERDARLTAEYVTKAETFTHLPITPDAFGPVLRSIDELLPAAHADEVLRLFKAASEASLFESITKSYGHSSGGAAGSAADRITKAAEALVLADPSLTIAVATDRVLTTQTDLAAAYHAERG